jgi:DNA-binding NarL/FixJ family response regulator
LLAADVEQHHRSGVGASAIDPFEAFTDLSERELKVLALIAQGKTNREIAAILYLGEGTVRNYVSNILDKLGLSNRAEATAYAVRHNLEDYLKTMD